MCTQRRTVCNDFINVAFLTFLNFFLFLSERFGWQNAGRVAYTVNHKKVAVHLLS